LTFCVELAIISSTQLNNCMSNDLAKFINSRRRHKTDVAISRQVKIAKSHSSFNERNIRQTHRLAKHHAMDCGNPKCYLCGNPRKTHKDKLTQQEKRLFQNLDEIKDKHSNGLTTPKDLE
jgi:hypothetical protein